MCVLMCVVRCIDRVRMQKQYKENETRRDNTSYLYIPFALLCSIAFTLFHTTIVVISSCPQLGLYRLY